MRQVHGRQRGAQLSRCQGARVAMGEHTGAVLDESQAMLADRSAHRGVFIADALSFFQQVSLERRDIVDLRRAGAPAHPIQSPDQVDRRRPGTGEVRADVVELREKPLPVGAVVVANAEHRAHGRGNADRRCAANAQAFDRLPHRLLGSHIEHR